VAIDVLQALEETNNQFRGAVILTYTLNLDFFEQLIAPRLDAIGCTNVLILTDVHGYDDALSLGARSLTGVGTRYVCAPLLNPGKGIQHAKLILLTGPNLGRLLVGSGNLTLHGYGRNLEQFTRFDLAIEPGQTAPADELYPFFAVWEFLQLLGRRGAISAIARDRLHAIGATGPWLAGAVTPPPDLRLWHTFDRSLFSQLTEQGPLDELQIIAPFFDLVTIGTLVQRLEPRRLVCGIDALSPNLDGSALAAQCQAWGCELSIRTLAGRDGGHRPLHAKTMIGLGPDGAWCVSGSANCTRPAWLGTWVGDGNLELVVWHHSSDSMAFQEIWTDDLLMVQERDASGIHAEEDSIEADDTQAAAPLRLVELSYQSERLTGRFTWKSELPDSVDEVDHEASLVEGQCWALELLRRREAHSFEPDREGRFTIPLPDGLSSIEAGRVVAHSSGTVTQQSPYHWIDQPAELARYGHRTYHARVKQGLQTFAGAGNLFEELLNYLWERVDPKAIQRARDDEERGHRRFRGRQRGDGDDGEVEAPPPPEAFITEEELAETLAWHVDAYVPHDRSLLSLRDLLSLALLRLTTETVTPNVDIGDTSERDEDADAAQTQEQEEQREAMLTRLSDYLRRYSRRYAQRLINPAFVTKVGPELLFENHYTLGRVLLEFASKVDVFTLDDLRQGILLILGGLFWPEGAGLDGNGAWDILIEAGCDGDTLRGVWEITDLPALTTLLICEAWDEPPGWQDGLWDEPLVQRFMLAQALLDQIEQRIGQRYWEPLESKPVESQALWGFRWLTDLAEGNTHQIYSFTEIISHLDRLASYQTPVEEKYANLLAWWRLEQKHQGKTVQATELIGQVHQAGYTEELQLLRSLPPDGQVLAIQGETEYCACCYIQLPIQITQSLRHGRLALCPNCRRAALYWKPVVSTA
jgi:hypothetical protein